VSCRVAGEKSIASGMHIVDRTLEFDDPDLLSASDPTIKMARRPSGRIDYR
jgi:hypothetical protein